MPTLKTNRGAAKRFRQGVSGFKCKHSHRNHILTKKSMKRKRHLRKAMFVSPSHQHAVTRLLQGA